MKLTDLKRMVDSLMIHGHGEDEVLITTSELSFGARSSEKVSCVSAGFDWEQGQIRIAPSQELVHRGYTRNDLRPMYIRKQNINGRTLTERWCSQCDCFVHKDGRYCEHCGQRIDKEHPTEV